MSKKNSYMDRKNILGEGVVTYALEKLFKLFVAKPVLKKSKKFKNNLTKLNKSVDDLQKSLNDELKSIGSNETINIKKYKLKDFIK